MRLTYIPQGANYIVYTGTNLMYLRCTIHVHPWDLYCELLCSSLIYMQLRLSGKHIIILCYTVTTWQGKYLDPFIVPTIEY